MKTPIHSQSFYKYQPETVAAHAIITEGTVAAQEATLGLNNAEPLLVIMDSLLRYAKGHAKHYESPIGNDSYCAPYFAQMLHGCRMLLSAQGGVALERGMSKDSKDNGAIETLYWKICEVAGMDGDSLPEH